MANSKADELIEELTGMYPTINFSKLIDQGPVVANISHYAKKEEVSLVVMATAGAEGIKKWFIGSFSAGVVDHSRVPVLVIPEDYEPIEVPKRILFATDYGSGEPGPLEQVATLAEMVGAEILITHINLGMEPLPNEMFDWYKGKIEEAIPYTRKSFHLITGEELQETLDSFVKLKQTDLIVMSIKERTFWDKVISKSETKEMAYHPPVPLLTYHLSSFRKQETVG